MFATSSTTATSRALRPHPGLAIFIFGLPSAILWIKLDSAGVAFPEFLEVQDHIWGYGLMFSGLFIAFSIWKYGYLKWRAAVEEGTAAPGFAGYMGGRLGLPRRFHQHG